MTYYMINMLKHNKLSLQQSNFDVILGEFNENQQPGL